MSETTNGEAGRGLGAAHLLADAVVLLQETYSRFGNVHDANCAQVKSGRRKWGRIEPCNCSLQMRRKRYDELMARYSANAPDQRPGE